MERGSLKIRKEQQDDGNALSILLAIFIFGCIIAIHEFGHFVAAKCNGIQVNEFAIGMGPKILRFQKGETLYSLRLLQSVVFVPWKGKTQKARMSGHLTESQFGGV